MSVELKETRESSEGLIIVADLCQQATDFFESLEEPYTNYDSGERARRLVSSSPSSSLAGRGIIRLEESVMSDCLRTFRMVTPRVIPIDGIEYSGTVEHTWREGGELVEANTTAYSESGQAIGQVESKLLKSEEDIDQVKEVMSANFVPEEDEDFHKQMEKNRRQVARRNMIFKVLGKVGVIRLVNWLG
jgi:hypothetical protein